MDNTINYKELLQHCVNILDSHHYFTNKHLDVLINNNMNFYSEEELYEKYIITKKITDENQRSFIKEVVFGCVRYHKIIKLLLKCLFEDLKSNLKKEEDYTIFVVLSYLILFRLKELGYNNFKAFVDTQPTRKIYKLLEFIFNDKNLAPDGRLKSILKDLLDNAYIEKEILEPLRSVLHQNKKIMGYLEKKINLGMTVKKNTKVTKIKPFLLTKPKPRSLPEPTEIIYRKIKPTVLTNKVLKGSNDKEILQKKKEENKKRIMQRYEKEKKNQFEIVKKTLKRPLKVQPEETPPSPKLQLTKLPKFKPNNVKLNVAAILREEKLLEKQKKKKELDLNNIEVILNKNDFNERREKLKEKELEERKLNELKKRFEIQLLHEDALDAKEDLIKEKQEIVQQIKEEKEENQKFIEESKKIQEQINKEFIKQVHDIEVQATEAKKKMMETKKKNADEIKDESNEIKIQIQKQQEEELEKKAELIKQIRILEKYVMNYKPEIDLTETPNYGFLNEMSIVELKQRLTLAKEAAKEEENRQRELILARKKDKTIILNKIKKNIEKDRIVRSEQRMKNEKNKMERQKRLEDLLNEKMNIHSYNDIYSLKSIHSPTSNLDSIQTLVYQLQQKREQRLKRRNNNKKCKDKSLSTKSLNNNNNNNKNNNKINNINNNINNNGNSNDNSLSVLKSINSINNNYNSLSTIKSINDNINLPQISNNNLESSFNPSLNNNTINLTLQSDKFIIIPNNEVEHNQSLNALPNVYSKSNAVIISNNSIYSNKDNDINEKNRKSALSLNSSDISSNNYSCLSSDKYNENSNTGTDFYTKKQLKNAERNYERKINMFKHQEKIYNEELLRKQMEKKNVNVNFQINEIKS
ncbi:hypothetical protein BCR32DRAFT_295891 [Anaeromyces robustus]|uniref:Uncharacterized protein n=1 Tax=Anaeromyces robustus TaxID=1754192 RepID=A0A1Y1WTZ6_9FUNG|nr:hypothetical protein BCR32DRAFT_295891 [Anaeromyces robustus]|eukprot:ORX77009.1 hypothetical protein BCR32DRAFT_295891 [Anaeromyces robustus]